MRLEGGYGLQEDVIDRLLQKEVEFVVIDDGIRKVRTCLADWLINPARDYGNGKQRFLPSQQSASEEIKQEGQLALV
jgi:hypothetical protein